MKPNQIVSKFPTALALVVLAVGCASHPNLIDQENVAVAAGFKVITPKQPAQVALLRKLPPDKITPIKYGGKPYFVLPDQADKQAYVGGPKQYQLYEQLRRKQIKDSENVDSGISTIQVEEVNTMNWGEWDGWGMMGGMDGLGEPGWY